jgi:hypothetical protein
MTINRSIKFSQKSSCYTAWKDCKDAELMDLKIYWTEKKEYATHIHVMDEDIMQINTI